MASYNIVFKPSIEKDLRFLPSHSPMISEFYFAGLHCCLCFLSCLFIKTLLNLRINRTGTATS